MLRWARGGGFGLDFFVFLFQKTQNKKIWGTSKPFCIVRKTYLSKIIKKKEQKTAKYFKNK